jgi:hypothetical protein
MPLTEALMLVESPPTRHGLRSMAGLFFFVFFVFVFVFFYFSQVSALDVAWTILVVSQIFSYRQLV